MSRKTTQESAMQGEPAMGACVADTASGSREWSNGEAHPALMRGESLLSASKDRLARLARTIEADVIPRLVQAHRLPVGLPLPTAVVPTADDVDAFLQQILTANEDTVNSALVALRGRGVSVEALYLDLFAPVARQLGQMWADDVCDFSTVTVGLGRLQRLLRELSPAFGTEIEHPPLGRRALFVQPRGEQHSFGLSMVAEFFRREGWDVIGGIGGTVTDPAVKVRDEWVDIIGFSIGNDRSVDWLRDTVRQTRAASRNPALVVLVGGPPFNDDPERALSTGADGTARDAREAPQLAERLMAPVASAHTNLTRR
jgi:MerR family transcriptional regulator, light-induced transcriptional regulator